jgi:hypothetical protein
VFQRTIKNLEFRISVDSVARCSRVVLVTRILASCGDCVVIFGSLTLWLEPLSNWAKPEIPGCGGFATDGGVISVQSCDRRYVSTVLLAA